MTRDPFNRHIVTILGGVNGIGSVVYLVWWMSIRFPTDPPLPVGLDVFVIVVVLPLLWALAITTFDLPSTLRSRLIALILISACTGGSWQLTVAVFDDENVRHLASTVCLLTLAMAIVAIGVARTVRASTTIDGSRDFG